MNFIFIFLDGVGLASRSGRNPFFTTPMVNFKSAFGCEWFIEDARVFQQKKLFLPIDAGLGVEGSGESGTGQFSIYTGLNGAQLFKRHYGPYVPSTLRPILAIENIFKKLNSLGKSCCYANAYPKRFIDTCMAFRKVGKIRSSVLFEAAILESIKIQSAAEVIQSKAISGDIIARWWRSNQEYGDCNVEEISSEQAALNLLNLSKEYDAVFYEFFLTDLSAHGRISTTKAEIIQRLDVFLSTLVEQIPPDTLLLLTSDHGNLEDDSTTNHTTNPVPLIALGHCASHFQNVKSIDHILPTLIQIYSQK